MVRSAAREAGGHKDRKPEQHHPEHEDVLRAGFVHDVPAAVGADECSILHLFGTVRASLHSVPGKSSN